MALLLPSKLFVFLLMISLLLMSVEYSSAAKKPKSKTSPRKGTTTTTAEPTSALKEPGVDTMIYHSAKTNDRCECGAFKSPKKSNETPLYYQTAMQNFQCEEAKCKAMCLALPAFSDSRGIEILCAHVNQAQGLRPAVHYKNCNDNWMYAGTTPKDPICCDAGHVVACNAKT